MSVKETQARKEIRDLIGSLAEIDPSAASVVLTRALVFLASGRSGYPPPGPERELVRAARRIAKYEQERDAERKKEMA